MKALPAALVLALLLAAPSALAQDAPAARVELSERDGLWNGLSCARPAAPASAVVVWLPPNVRVHAATARGPSGGSLAPWTAAGRDAARVETPPEAEEGCVSFDLRPGPGLLARYRAPVDVASLHLRVTPPEGAVAEAEGLVFARRDPAEGRPVHEASLGALAAGEGFALRVVDEGRVGELPLLVTVGALSLVVLLGTLAWHAARPPLGGRPAERFLEHLGELQARLLPPAVLFAALNFAYFVMGLRLVDVGALSLPAPTWGVDASVSARAFHAFAERLVPEGVTLVALRPADAVLAQVQTGLFLSFVTVLPLLLYEMGAFLAPGLEPRERKALLRALPLLTALFLAGALFGYLLLAPLMIRTLYGYADPLGALPLLGIGDLVGFALVVMLAFALAFQLPVVMYGLSRAGLVGPGTFARYLRHAVLAIVILAGVVTPDPSVVSQLLVAGPVVGLYLVGIAAARLGAGRRGAAPAG